MARDKRGRFVKGSRRAGRRALRAVRRAGGRVRGFARRVRSRARSLGLVGKTGVAIMGGAPLAASGLEAADLAVREMRNRQLGIMGTAKVAFWNFLNNLSVGFGAGNLINTVNAATTSGENQVVDVAARVPGGSWFKTTVIGGTLVAFDIVISWASKTFAKVNSGVRFMGHKLTGGK